MMKSCQQEHGPPRMHSDPITFNIFLIFTGAALLATLALYARQELIVAYIVLGLAFGPWGLALVTEPAVIRQTSAIGIMFLLFLLGLKPLFFKGKDWRAKVGLDEQG